MLGGFRNLFSSGPVPYADPKSSIPLSAVLRHDWMELWYQPKVELRTTHLVGAEALVRACHPTRGIIPPGLFLPGASDDDMHELTERVILTALGDWEDFGEYSAPIKLAVNVPSVRAGQASNFPHATRSTPARGQLARVDPGSDRRPESMISILPMTSPTRCASSNASLRWTISAPAIRRWCN
ncbi:MAG: EAL domain-containing protein [Sphingobacteriales bacterium]